jgi:hypothetical protein
MAEREPPQAVQRAPRSAHPVAKSAIVPAASRGDPDRWAPPQPLTGDVMAKMVVICTVLRGQRRRITLGDTDAPPCFGGWR